MIWPWSKIKQLEAALEWERKHNTDLLWRCELRENLMIKAMRDQAAAHKGIRRLRARLDKALGKQKKEQP